MLSSIILNRLLNNINFMLAFINGLIYNQQQGGDYMTIEQKIKMALSYTGISQSELARQIGTTPQNFNQKLKRNSLTKEELEQMLHQSEDI